jgi:hypothetical protein
VWLEELDVMTNYFSANKYELIYVFALRARYLVFAKFGFSRQMLTKFNENLSIGAEFMHADGQT